MINKDEKVFVALSGGVDSSMALALLKERGYDVTGVYFKTYKPDGNREYCREQGLSAQKVCKQLDVPFKVLDLEEEYKQRVFDYMIREYNMGNTPNPDIICNKEIKFGVFAEKVFGMGADFLATGHYARVSTHNGNTKLFKSVDNNKDQSYFLSQVSKSVLSRTLFPVGEYQKGEIRKLAGEIGLHNADKKDSQGICFIGYEIEVKDFLKKYIKQESGDVLNTKGEVIGSHKGSKLSTIGERHGFTILPKYQTSNMSRLFVIKRDVEANTITVGNKEEFDSWQKSIKTIKLINTNWINEPPIVGRVYECRIRHRGDLYRCSLQADTVNFIDTPYALAQGQFLAVYDGAECLGGGEMYYL